MFHATETLDTVCLVEETSPPSRRIVPLSMPRQRDQRTSSAHIVVSARANTPGRNDATREQDRIRVTNVTITRDSHHCFYAGLEGDGAGDGVFVATYTRHELGTLVIVDVSMPELGQAFRARGVVEFESTEEFSNGVTPGFGVRFLGVSERAEHAIRDMARVRDPLFFEAGFAGF